MAAKFSNIIFLLLASAIPVVILFLPIAGYKELLTKIDWHSPFYIFTLQFAIGGLLLIKLFKDFANWLKSLVPSPQSLVPIFLITLIAAFICLFWIEGRSRVQMDEALYLSTAQNLYYNQIGTICSKGVFSEESLDCILENTIKPRGLSYLYMLGMHIFGTDLHWVYNFQVFILALTIPIFFLALLAWLKNKELALLTATLLGMQPVLLFYSRSSSIEGLYVLMFAISMLFLKWACDRNTTRHWLFLALILAFFAQTRSETVFCLFSFIGIAAFKMSNVQLKPIKNFLFSILNSQFSIFLATLSAFSLPILCTLSINRNSDLQGGPYGARGYLFSNIVDNFKLMAFPNYESNGLLSQPFLPYFTWICLLGITTLIILIIKEKLSEPRFSGLKDLPDNSTLSIKYRHVALFLLLLSPQYIILFDSVSADLNLNTQSRFVLIILPAMSFLGALFIWKIFSLLKNRVNPKILLIGVQTIILTITLVHCESFKANILYSKNALTKEDHLYKQFTREISGDMMFFSFTSALFTSHGISAHGYDLISMVNEEHLSDMLKIYNGNVFVTEDWKCDYDLPNLLSKMNSPSALRACDRLLRYFKTDIVFNVALNEDIPSNPMHLKIYKILGMSDIDPKGLMRITQKIERDSNTIQLIFKIPKDTIAPWKIEHFMNDSLFHHSLYEYGEYSDVLAFSQFNRDTNFWRLDIIDTITNEKIHSDFWKLVKVKR